MLEYFIEHPDKEIATIQKKSLDTCPEQELDFLVVVLSISNAKANYYKMANRLNPEQKDWDDFLSTLPEQEKGSFPKSLNTALREVILFQKYVLEKNGIMLSEYLKQNVNPIILDNFNRLQEEHKHHRA